MINALGKIYSSVTDVLDFNQVILKSPLLFQIFPAKATLSGCIDVIVADYGDGTYKSTPFHVRFGKLKLLKSKDRVVTVEVNDVKTDFTLKLGSAGEAYFEEAVNYISLNSLLLFISRRLYVKTKSAIWSHRRCRKTICPTQAVIAIFLSIVELIASIRFRVRR